MPADAAAAAAGDAELLAALRHGDRAAFETFYRRHAPWLTARLRYRCADAAERDDIVQETFLAVWRRCAEGRQPEIRDAAGWLWRIAERRITDRARTEGGQGRLRRALTALWPAPAAPSAEEQLLDSGGFGAVHAALGRLPADLREVVQATVLDGLTTRQTAHRLRLPAGTVKTRAMRARRRLREELAREAADPRGSGETERGGDDDPPPTAAQPR
ncbi:RNA polymerase sigma factor [Streptomyces sp. NPDC000594]|uniref:RNA polymerase sigma factor n=1 Tax=Streptomyces sp. NPDC000594 TaxID=3154261 RepID=UPI0033245728